MSTSRMVRADNSYITIRLTTSLGSKYLWLSDYDKAVDFINRHLPQEVDCKVETELIEKYDNEDFEWNVPTSYHDPYFNLSVYKSAPEMYEAIKAVVNDILHDEGTQIHKDRQLLLLRALDHADGKKP